MLVKLAWISSNKAKKLLQVGQKYHQSCPEIAKEFNSIKESKEEWTILTVGFSMDQHYQVSLPVKYATRGSPLALSGLRLKTGNRTLT